jgi:hypothetical protein
MGLHSRGNFEAFARASSERKWLEVHGLEHWTEFYTDYGVELQRRFFDHCLKGAANGWDQQPPVQLRCAPRTASSSATSRSGRMSHRKLDPGLSLSYRPWHPHTAISPLVPGETYEADVEQAIRDLGSRLTRAADSIVATIRYTTGV